MEPGASAVEPGSWRSWHSDELPLRVGVSACLLGENVRYDRGSVRDRFVSDVLGPWVAWQPACPEVEIGMSVPRPAIRLVEKESGVRLVEPDSGTDYTDAMRTYARGKVDELAAGGLDGYVLKKNSPSCGLERIRVYRENGHVKERNASGLFAARLLEAQPHLPVEEEGRLNDPALRENFIERIFCRNRWRNLLRGRRDRGALVAFHTAHKLLLWSHSEAGMRRMGRLLGEAGRGGDEELYRRYEEELFGTMKVKTSPKKHVNVLQHAMGYLKKVLAPGDKQEILQAIDDYRLGLLPLVVPQTLLRFNLRKYRVDYLLGQLYFDPHPRELLLRNHP